MLCCAVLQGEWPCLREVYVTRATAEYCEALGRAAPGAELVDSAAAAAAAAERCEREVGELAAALEQDRQVAAALRRLEGVLSGRGVE